MARKVFILHEGGDVPETVLCEDCIADTIDPTAARADIVRQDDAAHCLGCDYHVDPECYAGHWCAISGMITDPDYLSTAMQSRAIPKDGFRND